MLKLLRKTKKRTVEFCERCLSVCDAACRRRTLVDGNRDRALAFGVRV